MDDCDCFFAIEINLSQFAFMCSRAGGQEDVQEDMDQCLKMVKKRCASESFEA